MKKTKTVIAASILLLAGLAAFLIIYNQPGFTGERVKNPGLYTLNIQRMNGTDSHTMQLKAGDVLRVEFETEKGSLNMEITAPDGTTLYAGNGKETTEFKLGITKTGTYAITVKARNAKGSIYIQTDENSGLSRWNLCGKHD